MPRLVQWQRRLSHAEHAAAIQIERNRAAIEHRHPKKTRALTIPQTRTFQQRQAADDFIQHLKAAEADPSRLAITISETTDQPATEQLHLTGDVVWPLQMRRAKG